MEEDNIDDLLELGNTPKHTCENPKIEEEIRKGKNKKIIIWGCLFPLAVILIIGALFLSSLNGSDAGAAIAIFGIIYIVGTILFYGWPVLLLILIGWFLFVRWYQNKKTK